MVAKVISGKSIRGVLNYNEDKVAEGKAQCIMANLFGKDLDKLTFFDKLGRFINLNVRNPRTKTNTLHISLNFDASEKLKTEELNAIASMYMNRIGFGEQPYLVYQHNDAAHPHIHIATTLIEKSGRRIPIHFLGKNESEKARKEIEKEFNLVIAEKQEKNQAIKIPAIDIQKVIYGKSLTKKSIAQVVTAVTRNYRYTSLPELNAVLRKYHVMANRGAEHSKMFENRGLQYTIIDERGTPIGIPIKASALPGKPTLPFLETQFNLNAVLRLPLRDKIRSEIDKVLANSSISTKDRFAKAMIRKNIDVVFRSNTEGRTYGVTFIDNNNRTVFNGSDLGKQYSANALINKLDHNANEVKPFRPGYSPHSNIEHEESEQSMITDLFSAQESSDVSPEAALQLGRKRKRRKSRKI